MLTKTPPKTTPKEFKVAAISSNTGTFGHKGHILIARDGSAWQGDRQPNAINRTIPDLKKGDVLTFQVNDKGELQNWFDHRFEFMHRMKTAAPPGVVKEVWGD